MNSQLTTSERHESFFTTLGRLKTAIKQAPYSPEHMARALALYDKVAEEIADVSVQVLEVHSRLTTSEIPDHDCHTSPEDGCDCGRLRSSEEEEEEELCELLIESVRADVEDERRYLHDTNDGLELTDDDLYGEEGHE